MYCFFFNDTATTEIYTLSLHDALPIFAHDPTLVTMFVHYLTGIPYSFTAHAKDIYVKTSPELLRDEAQAADRKSTRLNSSHSQISYAVFCLKKKNRVDAP